MKLIICVDDDPMVLDVIKLALEATGHYQVKGYTSGSEALTALTTFQPHAILLDMLMPGMDGVAVLEKIKKIAPLGHVPVVFLTAAVKPENLEEYRQLGATGTVAKPIDVHELVYQVGFLLGDKLSDPGYL